MQQKPVERAVAELGRQIIGREASLADKRAETNLPLSSIDLQGPGPGAGRGARPAPALPCLLVTSATKSHGRRSRIARKSTTAQRQVFCCVGTGRTNERPHLACGR
jgi:hypothetical protein